jgi:hypothetical protein
MSNCYILKKGNKTCEYSSDVGTAMNGFEFEWQFPPFSHFCGRCCAFNVIRISKTENEWKEQWFN